MAGPATTAPVSGFTGGIFLTFNLETADACLETGQTDRGLDMLSKIAAYADDDLLYDTAQIYQKYGYLEQAEQLYEQLIQKYPDDSGLLLQLSDVLIDKKEEDRAINYLQRIGEADENYLSAQVMLADLYQQEGLTEVAEHKLVAALKKSPNEPVLQLALGELYLSSGKPLQAIDRLKAVRNNAALKDQHVELKLAEAFSLSGKFEQAMSAYRRGLKQEKTLDGLFGYAVTAVRLKQFETAIRALEELKDMDPGYSTLYPVLAHAYEHEGDLENALKTVEAGLAQDEYNTRLYQEAGTLAVKSHQPEKAAIYFNKWHEQDPENDEALTRLVELKAQQGDYQGILDLLSGIQPDDPMLIWFTATALHQTDRLPEAGKYYAIAERTFADNPDFLREYGEYRREMGQMHEGLKLLERASHLQPDDQDLAEFVERLKQEDE